MLILESLIKSAELNRVPEKAQQMADYMKNIMPFLGLPSPIRKQIQKPYFEELKKEKTINWPFIFELYKQPYREYHYIALDYLEANKKYLKITDIEHLKQLTLTNPWWDTTDCIDQLVGFLIQKFPSLKQSHIYLWMQDESIWLRRISIDCQLGLKLKTDTDLLEKAILSNLGSKEFFINKAIGWSLRDYSRHNAEWVRNFLERNEKKMANLSVKEASKYLNIK